MPIEISFGDLNKYLTTGLDRLTQFPAALRTQGQLARRRGIFGEWPSPVADPVDRQGSRAAVIINPGKCSDPAAVRNRLGAVFATWGWQPPLWLETTREEPGTRQAEAAVDADVDLVCCLGGDGTVRAVAAGLMETDIPLGLLPGGTGNLLARNLGLPVDDLTTALQIALTGRTVAVDVGTLSADGGPELPFLVMAGIGFDADVMADTDDMLKSLLGWPAYLLGGMKSIGADRFAVRLTLDDTQQVSARARSILFGNVGRVTLGLELIKSAQADDGSLELLMVTPSSLAGWAVVVGQIAAGLHNTDNERGVVVQRSFTSAEVCVDTPQLAQLDGDPIGAVTCVTVGVQPAALITRLP